MHSGTPLFFYPHFFLSPLFSNPNFFTPTFFYPHYFFTPTFLPPLFLKNLPKWKIFQLEKFPPYPFGLKIGTLTGPDEKKFGIFEKVGKVEIFRFFGKFSSTTNIPTHEILKEKFSIFPNWKIIHLLHSG